MLLTLLVWNSGLANAQNNWTFSLNITIKNLVGGEQLDGISIQIFKMPGNERVYTGLSSGASPVKFNLEAGFDYNVKVQKSGMVAKSITVSTKNVPVQDKSVPSYLYDVIMDMMDEKPEEDYAVFRQAFGMIIYDVGKKDFVWIVNPIAKEAEEKIKEKRKDRDSEEKREKQDDNQKLKSRKQLEELNRKREEAEKRSDEKSLKFKEDRERKEAEKKAYFENFKREIEEPFKVEVENIAYETKEGWNYVETKTSVSMSTGRTVVFRKIAFEWGGNYFKQDNYDITGEVYQLLTEKVFIKE